jgi:hypothetical protein
LRADPSDVVSCGDGGERRLLLLLYFVLFLQFLLDEVGILNLDLVDNSSLLVETCHGHSSWLKFIFEESGLFDRI